MNIEVPVSVIVPVYNVERYLRRCIDSVLAQTFADFELILVDDGSDDGSGAICDEYAAGDQRIRTFHKENGGVSSARNMGLDNACGKYVIFLDSDDSYSDVRALETLHEEAERWNADVVRGEYHSVDEDGRKIRTAAMDRKDLSGKVMRSDEFFIDVVNGRNFIWLQLFRLESLGGYRFPVNMVFLEDMHLMTAFFLSERRCLYVPLDFYAYRKRPDSASCGVNMQKYRDSFSFNDIFGEMALSAVSGVMCEYCRYNSVMMYYWTVETVAQDVPLRQMRTYIESLGIRDMHRKARRRILRWRVFNWKSLLVVITWPSLAMLLLKAKSNLVNLTHRLK